MSTAGRATYQAAKGSSQTSAIKTAATSARDQVGQTKLKYRQIGQASQEELKQKQQQTTSSSSSSAYLKESLEQREFKYTLGNNKETKWMVKEAEEKVNVKEILSEKPVVNFETIKQKYDDADIDVDDDDDEDDSSNGSDSDEHDRKRQKTVDGKKSSQGNDNDRFASSSDEDDDDDEDDDEAELQAELERIREERALAAARKEQEEREFQEKLAQDQALRSNPLVGFGDASAKMKRRWNDDVIFRNQAKDEPEYKKRFINDTIRSDFHKSFLKRYIK